MGCGHLNTLLMYLSNSTQSSAGVLFRQSTGEVDTDVWLKHGLCSAIHLKNIYF